MPYKLHGKLVAEAFASGRVPHPSGLVPMKAVHIGNLVVTSQAVVATDPIVISGFKQFTQPVPNGRHPVTVAIAEIDGYERIAFARVQFSMLPSVSWKMAVTDLEKDPDELGPGIFLGYGVDGATGCFTDPVASKLMGQRYKQEGPYFTFGDVIMDAMELTDQSTRGWCDVRLIEEREENIICFTSGCGDGFFPSFFAFDANCKVCQLVTDFLIFGEEGSSA